MIDDALLYWLTQTGQGSWATFQRTVARVASATTVNGSRDLPMLLSDLGFISFFVDGSDQWRVRPPALVGLSAMPNKAALCGARTSKLVDALLGNVDAIGCEVEVSRLKYGIRRITTKGSDQQLTLVAKACGISYLPDYAGRLCKQLPSIFDLIEAAPQRTPPQGWTARSFDLSLDDPTWVDGFQPGSACRYTRGYGIDKYLLHIVVDEQSGEGKFLAFNQHEAVYAAAALQGKQLASYDPIACLLTTHPQATLPPRYAQAVCLCAAQPSDLQSGLGKRIYRQVDPLVATNLLVLLGQSLPPFDQLPSFD